MADRQMALRDTSGGTLVPMTETGTMMEVIARAASDPNTDVSKLQNLMGLYERIRDYDAKQQFNSAMSDAQAEMRPIAADATNPQTRSNYATYAQLDRALRPIYTRHGFGLSFDTGDAPHEAEVRVLCYVSHKVGHERTYKFDMPADGKGAKGGDVMTRTHAAGSAMSYGQRYLLKAIFNIAVGDGRDDDGNAANGGAITEAQRQTLQDLIEKTGADVEKFCAFMKSNSLVDIPAKEFGRAVEALNMKRKAVSK